MKKIILSLILIGCTCLSFSQTMYKNYKVAAIDSSELVPRYLIGINDSNKQDTLGIVITLKQAQKIDNDYDLLNIYKSMHINCDSTVNYLVQVVDDYKQLNVLAQQKIRLYETIISDQKKQITNLKSQIVIKTNQITTKDSIILDKGSLLDISKLEIKKYKKQRNKSIELGASISLVLFWLLIGHPGIK